MADYIDREETVKTVRLFNALTDDEKEWEIRRIPSADVAPVRHGSWINCEWIESGFKFVRCSECDHADMDSRLYKYCPWCGARMDEEADNE